MDEEKFKSVKDFPKYYVSDQGTIFSLQSGKAKILRGTIDKNGYTQVQLSNSNGKKLFRLHRLILLTFVPPKRMDLDCCHCDGNPQNNSLYNLRWDTRTNNMADAINHGTLERKKGSESHNSILSEADVKEIRSLYKRNKFGYTRIGKLFGVTSGCIANIINGKNWGCLQ